MRHSSICLSILLIASVCVTNVRADSFDDSQIWSAGAGQMQLELRGDYLPDFGLELIHQGRPITTRTTLDFPVVAIAALQLHAPWGHLESLDQEIGRLQVHTGLSFRHGSRQLALDPLFLVPGEDRGLPLILALDGQDRELFRMSHLHIHADGERGRLQIANAEVEASRYLAEALDLDALAELPIAVGGLDLALEIPAEAIIDGAPPGCEARPIWPQDGQFEADVTLIDMEQVAYQGIEPETGRVKLAPSARLKNESLADIPWFPQFTNPTGYPYEPSDQHPFLAWNIYRVDSQRIRMLARSGAKHAFFATNQNCDLNCGGGQTLWPGCEDTYSSGNNDTSTYQAPRDEIAASLGLWDSCGSFFDPGCSGAQTGYAGQWNHRLLIDPDEFDTAQPGTLYMDAWYLIQHDVNIWNSMGFRPFNPQPLAQGWIMNPGAFQQGPVINEWIAEDENDAMQSHSVIVVPSATPGEPYPENMPQGHLRLLVKVREVGPGRYRYNYAIQNYDFERGLEGFRIGLPENAEVFTTWFGDIDDDPGNDWTHTIAADHILFTAPPDNTLDWGMLFNFEIEVSTLPTNSSVTLDLGENASIPEMIVTTLAPGTETGLVFHDRFESAP